MGLYNFKPEFVPFVEDGTKTHTIRAPRKNPDKPGDTLHLYTGLRRKGARLLMRVPCVKVEEIVIAQARPDLPVMVYVDGSPLSPSELESLAWRDGFRPKGTSERKPNGAWSVMERYWRLMHGILPFEGHIIHWAVRGAA